MAHEEKAQSGDQNVEEIEVGFYGSDSNRVERGALEMQLEELGIPSDRIHSVKNVEQMEKYLKTYSEMEGVRVKTVYINDHGDIGAQGLNGWALSADDIKRIAPYVSRGGRINLLGCRVAGSGSGSAYLKAMARATNRLSVSGYTKSRWTYGPKAWGGGNQVVAFPNGALIK